MLAVLTVVHSGNRIMYNTFVMRALLYALVPFGLGQAKYGCDQGWRKRGLGVVTPLFPLILHSEVAVSLTGLPPINPKPSLVPPALFVTLDPTFSQ